MLQYYELLGVHHSEDGLAIKYEFSVRSETYVSIFFTVLLLWKRFVCCDFIIVSHKNSDDVGK